MELGKQIGIRIRDTRNSLKLTQVQLAKIMGMSVSTIGNYEKGKRDMTAATLMNFSEKLCVTPCFLISGETPSNLEKNKMLEITLIPMGFFIANSFSDLNNIDTVKTGITYVCENIFKVRGHDVNTKPFGVYAEGESMIGAGLKENSIAIINPAEEVVSGDTALVNMQDHWFIKWVVYNPDGSVELRPANGEYKSITIEKKFAKDSSWLNIIGKVVQIIEQREPKKAF